MRAPRRAPALRGLWRSAPLLGAVYLYAALIVCWRSGERYHAAASSSLVYWRQGYSISGYYISYASGFIRRGLPGAVLALFTTPSHASAAALFWVLTAITLASVLTLAALVAAEARGRRRALVALVLIASPFTIAGAADYLGRYDAIALTLLALVVLAARAGLLERPVASAAALSVAVVVATLSEEIVFPYLVPVVLACAWRLRDRPPLRIGRMRVPAAIVLAVPPLLAGAVAAVVSSLTRASPALVAHAHALAGVAPGRLDSAAYLGYSLEQELRFMRSFGVENLVLGSLVWVAIFAATCVALRSLLGLGGRAYWACAAYCAALAACLCLLGSDWRRWWLMAFAALLATVLLTRPRDVGAASPVATAGGRLGGVQAVALWVLLALAVGGAYFTGVFPVGSFVQKEYWKSDATYWAPGHHGLACALHLSASSC